MTTKKRWTDQLARIFGLIMLSAAVCTMIGVGIQKLWLRDIIRNEVIVSACTPARVDALIRQKTDPILCSLSILNRKILRQAVYQTIQMDELLGPAKAAKAEEKYLKIVKSMEGNR